MPKKQYWTVGDVLVVPLADGKTAYAALLESPLIGFIAGRALQKPCSFEGGRIAFYAMVHHDAVRTGRWVKIGRWENIEIVRPWFFKLDALSRKLVLRQHVTGIEKKASVEDIFEHEPAVVWDPEDIEARLVEEGQSGKSATVDEMRRYAVSEAGR